MPNFEIFLVALLVVAASAQTLSAPNCTTLAASDVPFCSMLVGRQVDTFFNDTISPSWGGKSYIQYIDSLVQQTYNNASSNLQ